MQPKTTQYVASLYGPYILIAVTYCSVQWTALHDNCRATRSCLAFISRL